MNDSRKYLRTLGTSLLLATGILSSAISHADDTEIFFGGPAIDEGIQPNVLFILDNSGSMNWRLDSNNNATGGTPSRMDVLKDTFEDILGNTSGINAGVMVLNSRSEYNSSRFMFPVTDIDSTLPTGTQLVANSPSIQASGDDATQTITPVGTAVIDSPSLVMGAIDVTTPINNTVTSTLATSQAFFRRTISGVDYACRFSPPAGARANCNNTTALTEIDLKSGSGQQVLFNFGSLSIPAGATIQNAFIFMRPTNSDGSRNPDLSVRVERNKTPAALNDNSQIGTRTYDDSTIRTSGGWNSGRDINIDVTSQIQALKAAAPAGDPISGMFVRISSTSNRTQKICTAGSCMPRLEVTYTTNSTTAENRMGALRFQDVGVPQGATITSASISFVPAATSTGAVTYTVKAENTDNAAIYTAGSNLTARTTTTAVSTWSPDDWTLSATPEPIVGPDVTNLVQEVVNRTGWCGNNAMAFQLTATSGTANRIAYSFDGGGGLQPVLNVSYTGGDSGCLNPIIEFRVNAEKNDGYEESDGDIRLGNSTLPLDQRTIAARYELIPVVQGAQVLDAKVIITPSNNVTTPSQTSSIDFHDSNNSSAFSTNDWNFYGRSRTSSVNCTFNNTNGGWLAGQPVTCTSAALASSLQSVFARTGWAPNNAISMFLNQAANSSLDAVAYETNPSQSLKLRFKVRSGDTVDQTTTTVKNHLISLVNNMYAESGTPIVPTMYDAARYLRGSISARPTPITSSCQATHLVLLTDGQANGTDDDTKSGIAGIIGESCTGDATADSEKCARSLAEYLYEEDQSTLPDENNVITHTVGFAMDASGTTGSAAIKQFLQDVASNGGGTYNAAESSADLAKAFKNIIQQVLSTDASFVSASAPVNSFNRQDNKDQVYFSVFKPLETDTWQGNLKRYRLDAANAKIVDLDDIDAVDLDTGFFKTTARSWWSATDDGNQTAAGGAANQLPAAASRKLYTYVGNKPSSSTSLDQGDYLLNDANDNITLDVLGVDTDEERTSAISFIRGLTATSTERKAMGDPLHSSPRLATYACNTFSTDKSQCLDEDQSAIFGSNEGFIHVVDTSTGVEQFAFMPQELLKNVPQLQANLKSTSLKPRPYGMDNTVTLWVNDANKNGVIIGGYDPETGDAMPTGVNENEFVYAYATMGRGGNNIYALDITNRDDPKVLWEIKGNAAGQTPTVGFERLGQTWSAPTKTRINLGGTITDVLIFAGGYDADQDEHEVRTADDVGNAIYIVNAETGELIWSVSNANGHTLQLSDMDYSIPSSVRVIDLQQANDGSLELDDKQLADQFFVGDMGGQVWRFYINNGESGDDLVTPAGTSANGLFATVTDGTGSVAQLEAKARRFYHEPDIALLNLGGTLTLTVNIGSGYRGHPLNDTIQDRFYSFRTSVLTNTSSATETTLTESDLYDAKDNLVEEGTASEKDSAKAEFQSADGGWMITLNTGGEKVLSRALTVGGKLFFNTYEPTVDAGSCSASVGINRAYTVSLEDATPAATDVSSTSPSARYSVIKTTGLLADPTVSSIGKDTVLLRFPSIEKIEGVQQGKTYWMDVETIE